MSRERLRDALKVALLILAVVVGAQRVMYWSQVQAVQKTLEIQLATYHERGEEAFRTEVLHQLAQAGVVVHDADLRTAEDRRTDAFTAEVSYRWPLRILWWTQDRSLVASTRTTSYGT